MIWYRKSIDKAEIEKTSGAKIHGLFCGLIETGSVDEEGNPVLKECIKIDFEKEPTAEQLRQIDLMLPELKREGGKSLVDEVSELKSKITTLEAKVK